MLKHFRSDTDTDVATSVGWLAGSDSIARCVLHLNLCVGLHSDDSVIFLVLSHIHTYILHKNVIQNQTASYTNLFLHFRLFHRFL